MQLPGATVTGSYGRASSFEVTVTGADGKALVAHSKLGRGTFPDFEGVADDVHAYVTEGKMPPKWTPADAAAAAAAAGAPAAGIKLQ